MNNDRNELDKALLDPTSVFDAPQHVVDHENYSHEQKIKILKRWEYDARELEVAEEENMGSDVPSILDEVLNALHKLNVSPDIEHSPPTKQGGE